MPYNFVPYFSFPGEADRMARRYEFAENGTGPAGDSARPAGRERSAVSLAADLGGLLDTRPVFESRLHGYDRYQVDEYVIWAEEELATVRRAHDELRARAAATAAELAELRRRPAPPQPAAQPVSELTVVSERVRGILLLASDEASAMVAAATEEAEQLVADARVEADARLEKAALLREAAAAMVEQLREQVARHQAEAAELLERARREADDLLRAAAEERDRLAAEAAERLAQEAARLRQERDAAAAVAAGRLLAARDEVEELRRQRDAVRESLRGLAEHVGEALRTVGAAEPGEPVAQAVPEPTPAEDGAAPREAAGRSVPEALVS